MYETGRAERRFKAGWTLPEEHNKFFFRMHPAKQLDLWGPSEWKCFCLVACKFWAHVPSPTEGVANRRGTTGTTAVPCLKWVDKNLTHVILRWTNLGSVPGSQTRHEFRYMNMCVMIFRWGDPRLISVKFIKRTDRAHKRVDKTSTRSSFVNHTLCITVTTRITLHELLCRDTKLKRLWGDICQLNQKNWFPW